MNMGFLQYVVGIVIFHLFCEVKFGIMDNPECDPITELTNGQIELSNGFAIDSKATFSCDEGYDLHGVEKTVCKKTSEALAEWEDPKPECLGPTAQIGCRKYIGKHYTDLDVHSFRSIRFAEAPVGPRRFKPPVPTPGGDECESGDIETVYALTDPPQCYQKDIMATNIISGSEDCLFLNLFTPSMKQSKKLPVLVYMHGGYLQFGNAYWPGPSPEEKNAAMMGVVIVSIQYRLGPFGFLVTEADNGTGNYAMLDQILAFQWVQDNIHKFGGDPNDVTISGLSSGGTSVFFHLASPLAKGLFHRAILTSASPILEMTLAEAREQNQFFLDKTGCDDEICLQDLDASDVIEAIYPQWNVYLNSIDLPTKGQFEPGLLIVNGVDLPVSPFDAWDNKMSDLYSDVPVIVSTTAQELDWEPPMGIAIKTWTDDDLHNYVAQHFDAFNPNFTDIILDDLYNVDGDAEYILTTIMSDIKANCGNNLLANKLASAISSPVYRYIVTHPPSHEAHPFGLEYPAKYAFHAWDIYAWFDTFAMIIDETTEEDHQYFSIVQDNLGSFVVRGKPADQKWNPYPENTALFNSSLVIIEEDYHARQCTFWNDNDFFQYSWIN